MASHFLVYHLFLAIISSIDTFLNLGGSLHEPSSTRPDSERRTGVEQMKGQTASRPPEQQTISAAEKEELQLLRSMMKDVHDRNARFYKQVSDDSPSPV